MSCSQASLPVKMELQKAGLASGEGPVPARPLQHEGLLTGATVPSLQDARPHAQSISTSKK